MVHKYIQGKLQYWIYHTYIYSGSKRGKKKRQPHCYYSENVFVHILTFRSNHVHTLCVLCIMEIPLQKVESLVVKKNGKSFTYLVDRGCCHINFAHWQTKNPTFLTSGDYQKRQSQEKNLIGYCQHQDVDVCDSLHFWISVIEEGEAYFTIFLGICFKIDQKIENNIYLKTT